LLSDHGVRPAPGYFSGDYDVPAAGLPGLIDAARRHASVQAELGLTEVFLASHLNPARIGAPAIGTDFDAARLELVIERIAAVAGAITAEGVTPCFHPHVGSWIETEHEVRAMLDSVDASILSFGPDTGHLFWAGMNPAAVIADYAPRVRAVHLKDVHRPAAVRAREQGDDYMGATVTQHVWTEPGARGRGLRRRVRHANVVVRRMVRGRGRRPRPADQRGVDGPVRTLDPRPARARGQRMRTCATPEASR
jgi:inosose dehydratase